MGGDPQEFIEHAPCRVPGGSLTALLFEHLAAAAMGRLILVGRVHQHVGVHHEH